MKFGRVDSSTLSAIDFTLPADAPATQELLASLPQPLQKPCIYIGCSVWTERSLVGRLYPPGTTPSNYLRLYSQRFSAVELNTTFYGTPSIERVQKWQKSVTPGFKFCPKVPQQISHSSNLGEQFSRLDTFLAAILHLQDTLGMSFLQLPPYCSPSRMGAIQKLLAQVPAKLPWAVEFRHPAWFSDQVAQQDMFDFLKRRGMAVVISDVAGRRDVLHQTLTTSCAFIRFQGYAAQPSNYTRLDAWIARLHAWLEQGLQQAYLLLHEKDEALCVDLALYVIRQLKQRVVAQLLLPSTASEQASLF
ncbi:MAG: DUF72 domain-containing protein [Bacteroidota bacterium]